MAADGTQRSASMISQKNMGTVNNLTQPTYGQNGT